MLQSAVKKHEQNVASSRHATSTSGLSARNTTLKSPLLPTSASTLNGADARLPRSSAGIKRTASGIAKVVGGSFENNEILGSQGRPILLGGGSPVKAQAAPIIDITGQFNEDDFDSDVDLEVAEPLPLKPITYPALPKPDSPKSFSIGGGLYPTLPRQQQAHVSLDRGINDGIYESPGAKAPVSSAPLVWSSSPVEHHAAKNPNLRPFAFNPVSGGELPRAQQPESTQAPAAKRRTIPWLAQATQDQTQAEANTARSGPAPARRAAVTQTPASKKSQFPWNTSVSAMKEQQKKHREEARVVKKADFVDEAVAKAVKSNQKRPASVFLSDEQKHVLELVNNKNSVFFTGSAGTGKSVLLREIISSLRKSYARDPDRVAVTASTGLAACNVGGITLHSFSGIGLGKEDVPELVKKIKKNQKARQRWMRTKVLIIDEVSMVDGDLFDKLESIARQIRGNARPFGGIQLVITGDFFQLPPVPDYNKVAKFAFDAATWRTSISHTIGLHHVFRQKDPKFAGMLNEMREGRLSEASVAEFKKLSRPLPEEDQLVATELFPTRAEVDKANNERLLLLQGKPFYFTARDGGSIADKTHRDKLLQNCMAPENIVLKKGAQVMLIKNIDESLVNGSIGRVMAFMDERQFESYSTSVDAEDSLEQSSGASGEGKARELMMDHISTTQAWPLVRFTLADGTHRDLLCQGESWKIELPTGEVQASRTQVPLILAWALSIHKAQGQTLDRVKVDLGKVFEKGQAYVALSRATRMEGLQVLRFDPKKVNAHERVRDFYSKLSRVEHGEQKGGRAVAKSGARKGGPDAFDYEAQFVDGAFDDWGNDA